MGAVRGVAAVLAAIALTLPAAARAGEAWSAERAFVELERLEAEVRTLRALAGAQAALLAWNRERAESGGGPAVLPEALCRDPEIAAWCRVLPATFGADAGRAAETLAPANGQGEDDKR